MRTQIAIENLLLDLTGSLALMYKELVEESAHSLSVNKDNYNTANTYYQAIIRELNCSPDINRLNGYLNELLSLIPSCAHIANLEVETLVLQCDTNRSRTTYWVADETECESASFSIYASVTSFTVPDLVSGYDDGQIEIILLAETGGLKQLIQVEKTFIDSSPLSAVYYWNESIMAYINVNKVSNWTSSDITKDTVAYVQYTYNGPNRGTSKTKFVF